MRVATKTSMSTGHEDWPPRLTAEWSPDVFAEGLNVHRVGDAWVTHCNTQGQCHEEATSDGSHTVYCNGKQVARIGDPVACGEAIATGRESVYVGD